MSIQRQFGSQITLALALATGNALLTSAEALDTGAANWMLPKVCIDQANRPIAADPYPHCPNGSQMRPLAEGDALPYRKMDQTRDQYRDIYPRMGADGAQIVVATFNWINPRYGGGSNFKIWADGYDVYELRDGWASVSETRNGAGEYATTFMGKDCRNYGGLVFFPLPVPDPSRPDGGAMRPVRTVLWEVNGEAWPGSCPTTYTTDQISTWSYRRDIEFGGVAGVPRRKLDTIVATMGFRTSKNPAVMKGWRTRAHLEVFYFTNLYGLSRWEAWVPEYQFDHDGREPAASTRRRAAGVNNRCLPVDGETAIPGDGGQLARISMTYEGQSFVMTDCRDWTNIVVEQTLSKPPAWPVSALNLLKNFHFSGGSVGVLEGWNTSRLAHASLQVSTTKEDTTKNTPKPLRGVAYLRLDCRVGCPNEVLYQDIPLDSPARRGDAYTLGVIGRSEAGPGSLSLFLTQLDSAGKVLVATPVQEINLSPEQTRCGKTGQHCRQFIYNPTENAGSVVLSSSFASRTIPVSLDPRATTLRFSITPASANVFDIVSAWLMRSP